MAWWGFMVWGHAQCFEFRAKVTVKTFAIRLASTAGNSLVSYFQLILGCALRNILWLPFSLTILQVKVCDPYVVVSHSLRSYKLRDHKTMSSNFWEIIFQSNSLSESSISQCPIGKWGTSKYVLLKLQARIFLPNYLFFMPPIIRTIQEGFLEL
jgi:hypothetical protein